MARLPFNPNMFSSPPPLPPQLPPQSRSRDKDAAMTVTQLAGLVKETLLQGLPQRLRIIGQISNLSDRTHWFFNLKDSGASMRCVCFASSARRVSFPVKDGMEVIATGRIDFYDAQGNVQFYVDKLEPVGVGELELKFRALCEELRTLGYFAIERKKRLPVMARGIAVITSKTGAALQDVINTAGKRWRGCRLMLFDVRVQGAAAAPEIARAVNLISQHGAAAGIDAVLLTRGGGSMEDLWAFNERIVADAVHQCRLPIVAAIGHETDTTIAELVADVRCATPTQAAMTLIPDQAALMEQVGQLAHRLRLVTNRHVRGEIQRFKAVSRHPFFRRPDQMYAPIRQRIESMAARLAAALPRVARGRREQLETMSRKLATGLPRRLKSKGEQFESLVRRLESISPLNVLKRGYSYTMNEAGSVLRTANEARPGERLTTVLGEGKVISRVEGSGQQVKETGDETTGHTTTTTDQMRDTANPSGPKRKAPSAKPSSGRKAKRPEQPGLF